jgi:uncharacterized protein (TIGR04141 family)
MSDASQANALRTHLCTPRASTARLQISATRSSRALLTGTLDALFRRGPRRLSGAPATVGDDWRDHGDVAQSSARTARMSVYHLVQVSDLRSAIRPKYFASPYDFEARQTTVAGREALVVTGEMVTQRAKWADTASRIAGTPIDVGNRTAAGAVLIRDGEQDAWAVTYGMGFQTLDQDLFDTAFGQRIALRSIDVADLSSLTRTTMDSRSHVDRLSIPSGDHLRNFGLSDFGELVTRVVAKARIAGLTDTSQRITLRGADALQLPLARTPEGLVSDLDVLGGLLRRPPLAGLELLEQVTLVRHDPQLIGRLDDCLEHALEDPAASRIGIAWPHEQLDENSTATGFKFQNAGRSHAKPQNELPTLDRLLAPLQDAPAGQRLLKLRRMKILLVGDSGSADDDVVSGAIPALRWLAFETDLDGRRYFLHNGSWYLVDHNYVGRLKEQTRQILQRDSGIAMPRWTRNLADEKAYNEAAAQALGAVNLDRNLIQTELHRHGIEPCDLLMADGTMIHVKMLHASDAASHLIAQALVSADALLYDESAVQQLRQKIEGSGAQLPAARTPKKVVLAMARPGGVTEDNLFTFTQVTLVRNVQSLQRQGVEVYVAPIDRE